MFTPQPGSFAGLSQLGSRESLHADTLPMMGAPSGIKSGRLDPWGHRNSELVPSYTAVTTGR
jgi:hypothetical protein